MEAVRCVMQRAAFFVIEATSSLPGGASISSVCESFNIAINRFELGLSIC